jgi:hypothetical protein
VLASACLVALLNALFPGLACVACSCLALLLCGTHYRTLGYHVCVDVAANGSSLQSRNASQGLINRGGLSLQARLSGALGAGVKSHHIPSGSNTTSHDHATHGAAAFVRFLILAVVEFPQGGVPANLSIVAAFASTLSHSTVIHTHLLWHFSGAVCCFSGVCACQAGGLLLLVAVHFCPFLLSGVCMGRGALVLLGCFVSHVRALWRHRGVDINELGGAYVRYVQKGTGTPCFLSCSPFGNHGVVAHESGGAYVRPDQRGGGRYIMFSQFRSFCPVTPTHLPRGPSLLLVAGCWLT